MGSIILAGLAGATRDYVHTFIEQEPTAEVWTLNKGLMEGYIPRADRFFEMHPIEMLSDGKYDKKYTDWLFETAHDYPVYMIDAYQEVTRSERFPLQAVIDKVFTNHIFRESGKRREQSNPYLTSTFSYMLGLAIYEGARRIYLPGYDMKTKTEYAYQKAGAEMLIGFAMGLGIEIILPKESAVMQAKLYGYERSQMVSRQRFEHWQRTYQFRLSQATSEINKLMGFHTELLRSYEAQNGNGEITFDQVQASADRANEKVFEAHRISGVLTFIEKMIEECDLQEPDEELPSRLMLVNADG